MCLNIQNATVLLFLRDWLCNGIFENIKKDISILLHIDEGETKKWMEKFQIFSK